MSRRPRNLQSDSYVHITQQCEFQEFLFSKPETREHYLSLLREVIAKFELLVLGYCVMMNHIHLLVKVGSDATMVSKAMHSLAGRMARHYNAQVGRRGHFWRERFHSTHICSGRHFRNVISYIDANPLNHKCGDDPIHWKYCSYHELQTGCQDISIVDRAALVKALRMQTVREFLAWQRGLMERQAGRAPIIAAHASLDYSGHYAIGTDAELRLLQRRLKKRGIYTYAQYLGLDCEGDPLWALDICGQAYATSWGKRHNGVK
ncbi:MAG: transposase [Victivallales bacterium]|nr:transposase [Victivallales bacterium]